MNANETSRASVSHRGRELGYSILHIQIPSFSTMNDGIAGYYSAFFASVTGIPSLNLALIVASRGFLCDIAAKEEQLLHSFPRLLDYTSARREIDN